MKLLTHEISTPWGKIASVVDVTNTPTVIGAGFKPLAKLIKQLPEKYREFDFKKDAKLAGVTAVVNDWVDGDLDAFSQLKVLQDGGDFTQSCWKMLRKVKGGKYSVMQILLKKQEMPKQSELLDLLVPRI